MGLPLEGIKVVEFSGLAPGPTVGLVLADFGADVIRIDKVGATLNPDTMTRGKKSIAISPKHPKGLRMLRTLISEADVIIDPFRPGVLERLGLGPKDVEEGRDGIKGNKKLVFARLTGYQRVGPYASMAGHDINYIAISGLLSMLGTKDGPPQPPINILGDFAGGSFICIMGILMALLERTKSGKGQVVEADMVTGARYLSTFLLLSSKLEHPTMGAPVNDGTEKSRGTKALDGGAPYYGVYKTKDNLWMSVGAIEPQFYAEFVQILSKHVTEDVKNKIPKPESQNDQSQYEKHKSIFSQAFSQKTRDEWTKIYMSTDACVAPILNPEEAATHAVEPRLKVEDINEGEPIVPQPAPHLSRTPARIPGGSPAYSPRDQDPGPELLLTPGEHTNEILTSWAGVKEDQILELYKSKAIGGPDSPEVESKL
jgi:alpha-methylacyl-CoA racemase